MADEAWVTLATNDTYAMSALVLAESLTRVATTRPKVILITSDVSQSMQGLLRDSFSDVVTVNLIDSKDEKILAAMKRPELGVTLTKIHCWSLTQYKKCVFLDADTLLLQNSDELFAREELSAVPDIGWPDCFNSGVFVFVPRNETFAALVQLMADEGSFDGGDQGLLNSYFSNWFEADSTKHLSFIYNMTLAGTYSYLPAYKKFGQNVKIVHFLGANKPWHFPYDSSSGSIVVPRGQRSGQQVEHVQVWWDTFLAKVQPRLTTECTGICAHLANLRVSPPAVVPESTVTDTSIDTSSKRRQLEAGQVDYLGSDSFDVVQKKLDEKINGK